MTTDAAGTPAPPDAATPSKNSFERIAGVLFSPGETFADIARKPDILVPLLVILVISYVTTFMVMPHLDFDAMMSQQIEAMQRQNPNMSESDMERVASMGKAMGKVMGYIGPLLLVVGFVVIAGILLGAFRLMGGEGTFKQALSVVLYAWFPRVILGIIATIVIIARGSFDPTQMPTVVKSNPAFLVEMKENPVVFSLLSNFDLFTIWTLILLIVGFAVVSRFSRAKSAAIIITLWAVTIVIKLGFAALGAANMKG